MKNKSDLFEVLVKPDRVVHFVAILFVIGLNLGIEFNLAEPLYRDVLELPWYIPEILSVGMAALFGIVAEVSGKVLARDQILSFFMSLVVFSILLIPIYMGQTAAGQIPVIDLSEILSEEGQDLGGFAFDEGNVDSSETHSFDRHEIVLALTFALFCCATFFSYLYERPRFLARRQTQELDLAQHLAEREAEIRSQQNELNRLENASKLVAEAELQKAIEAEEEVVHASKREMRILERRWEYARRMRGLMYEHVLSIIDSIYKRKFWFHSILKFWK